MKLISSAEIKAHVPRMPLTGSISLGPDPRLVCILKYPIGWQASACVIGNSIGPLIKSMTKEVPITSST